MFLFRYFAVVLLLLACTSCQPGNPFDLRSQDEDTHTHTHTPLLSQHALYNKKMVMQAQEYITHVDQAWADSLYTLAMDSLNRYHAPAQAAHLLLQAMQYAPRLKYYSTLATIYTGAGQYAEAEHTLQFLTGTLLPGKPDSYATPDGTMYADVWYQYALLEARLQHRDKALDALENALRKCLENKDRIRKESAFDALRGDTRYRWLMVRYFQADPVRVQWMNEYELHFALHSLPYTFSGFSREALDSAVDLNEEKFKSFVPGLTVGTRHPHKGGIYGALVRFPVDDTAFSILAYVRAEPSADTARGPVQVYLATYSATARLIDTLRFASRDIHGYSRSTLLPGHIVELMHFSYTGKTDLPADTKGKRILHSICTGSDLYHIDPTGHFRKGGAGHIRM